MGTWSREEIEQAFGEYQEAALEGGSTGNWERWARCFTDDATYKEHLYGYFEGRQAILEWITTTMSQWPAPRLRLSSVVPLPLREAQTMSPTRGA